MAAVLQAAEWETTIRSLGRVDYVLAGAICMAAGIALMAVVGEWSYARWQARRRMQERMDTLARIGDLDKRLKAIEKDREKEAKDADK